MKNFIKDCIAGIQIFRLITKFPQLMKVSCEIFNTLNLVAKEKEAKTQNIILDFNNGELVEVLNIWVCVGKDANPIIRIQELRKEIDELKKSKLNY